MAQSVEWARASSKPEREEDPGWTDAYGQGIDKGCIGVWLDEVMIEGTPQDFRDLADRFTLIADEAEEEMEAEVDNEHNYHVSPEAQAACPVCNSPGGTQ